MSVGFLISGEMCAQITGIDTGEYSPKDTPFSISFANVIMDIAEGKDMRTQVRTRRGGRKPDPFVLWKQKLSGRSTKARDPVSCSGTEIDRWPYF